MEVHPRITDELGEFIEKQHVFFVATAPLSGDGHVNLSPKGRDCLRILSPLSVGYLDITGSGNETSAHLYENGRITFMFCSFEGYPQILRLYGRGRTVLPGTPEWESLAPLFPSHMAARQLIVAELDRVQTSCGYGVPLMAYQGERDQMERYWTAKGSDAVAPYQAENNSRSIDGLPSPLGARLDPAYHE